MTTATSSTGRTRWTPRGVLSTLPERIRRHREDFALRRSAPGFKRALGPALRIEGFTAPVELGLLYHLSLAESAPGEVVEIGSYLGRSTVVLARAAMDAQRAPIVAVDPHTAALGIEGEQPRDTRGEFLENLEEAEVASHVRLLHTTSVEAASEWDGDPVRLLFVDGWHSREAVLSDVLAWVPYFNDDCCVVFDDFLPFPGVRAAVRELRADDVLGGAALIVGKMAAFGPKRILHSVPVPPGARALARLNDRALDLAIRLLAT